MSAHLQFGPEWMRKGPGKTSTLAAGDTPGAVAESTAPSASSIASSKGAAAAAGFGNNRRHPSLGNLAASTGPIPHIPAVTIPSPGAFSFAAAAQGGSGVSGASNPVNSSSSSAGNPHSSEGDSMRYSKRLLSLYSSERGGKGGNPAQAEAVPPTSSGVNQKKKSNLTGTGDSSSSDRDSRRSVSTSVDGIGAPRSHSPNGGELRGLNARTVSSSHEKTSSHRPGLFQRGSSSNGIPAAALSPTLFQSRERDRHGSGIQGGVLSGVAAPLSTRRRKDSEQGVDVLRSPRADVEHQWEQRRMNDAFSSARNRSSRATHDDSMGNGGGTVAMASGMSANGDVIETWSRFGGRRERAPGEGPIGPPADHSGGFAKFSGYDRKRERQASTVGSKRSTVPSEGGTRKQDDEQYQYDGQESSDVDLSKHATYVLDSLHLDDDEEGEARRLEGERGPEVQQTGFFSRHDDWSPERQDWLYRDPSGQVQGPFKANLMQDWYAAKYFSNDLLVRRAEDDEFQTLGEKLLMIGNVVTPFLIPPPHYVQRASEHKAEAVYEQPGGFPDHLVGLLSNQQQQASAASQTGWPGSIDVLNHFGGGVSNSGRNSPFATPQGHFAELDNGQRLRQRTQQEQYSEMLLQREIAEHRAFQEQRTAQMAAIAMAQAQGRDPATLGLWGPGSLLTNEWGHAPQQSQANYAHNEDPRLLQFQQQQTEPFDQGGAQNSWHPQQYSSHEHMQEQHQSQEQQRSHAPPAEDTQPLEQRSENVSEGRSSQRQFDDLQGGHKVPGIELESEIQPPAEKLPIEEIMEDTGEAGEAEEEAEEEEAAKSMQEEQAPEQAWPQSPSAVEFASEPLMAEEQWKSESPSRGKKSRRERAKQKVEEEAKPEQGTARSSAVTSGNVRTMSEEQFRRNQMSVNDSSTAASQAPLSSWLPEAPGGGASTPTKAAPWANSQQDGSTGGGMSLREIQEVEARQAEARKAARQRLQVNPAPVLVSSSGSDSPLPSTMSWGLASSIPNAANGRESASAGGGSASTPAPAWNARQAPKKTLMEIQEEQRARTQKVKEVQAAQLAAKSKGYADSASKTQGAPLASTGATAASNWSVVGASGKPSTPTAPTTILNRPVKATMGAPMLAQRSASNSSLGGQAAGWASGAAAGTANNPKMTATTAANVHSPQRTGQPASSIDGSPTPSPEFVRHCKEQLKGLSVKIDDFLEMLLSFPLDPSSDAMEIIAESVYASSSTLDGRRFAADFVAKRKLDAAHRRGPAAVPSLKSSGLGNNVVNGQVPSSTPRSASDVLRSGPSSDGFGGFKVVKAKGTKKRT